MSGPGEDGDDVLMAYADGVLVGAERAEVEAALAASPELRRRLEAFQATRPQAISRVFDPIVAAPVPEHLLALVMGSGAGTSGAGTSDAAVSAAAPPDAPRKSAEVLQFRRPQKQRSAGSAAKLTAWGPTAVAAAMIAALAIGSWQLRSPLEPRTSQVAAALPGLDSGMLAAVLGQLPSHKTAAIADWTVIPINTFAANDKRWCRELIAEKKGGPTYSGVACRPGAGQWSVVAAAERSPVHLEIRDRVLPSGERPPVAVEEAIHRLGNGAPLDPEHEQRLIASGWDGQH